MSTFNETGACTTTMCMYMYSQQLEPLLNHSHDNWHVTLSLTIICLWILVAVLLDLVFVKLCLLT